MTTRVLSLSAALLFVTLVASACNVSVSFGDGIEGSGVVVTESFDLGGFDEIRVSSAFEVDVEVGPEVSVVVRADDNLIEHLEVEVDDDRLRLGLDESLRNGTLEATVTLPSLRGVDISGASEVTIIGIDAADLDVEISGASEVTASGQAAALRLDASGASDVRFETLVVDTARVDISGASDIDLSNASMVRGDLSGASDLTVSEDADASVDTSGASTLNRS